MVPALAGGILLSEVADVQLMALMRTPHAAIALCIKEPARLIRGQLMQGTSKGKTNGADRSKRGDKLETKYKATIPPCYAPRPQTFTPTSTELLIVSFHNIEIEMSQLSYSRYGKDNIRLYKVHRNQDGTQDVVEMTVCSLLEGDIETS